MSVDANNWLMGGASAPSASFPSPGTTVAGTLVAPDPFTQQQRDFTSGEPKFFANGDAMMQLVITLATDERDPNVPDDDGTRRLYVRGQMRQALAEAVKRSGARGLALGGWLSMAYTHDAAPTRKGIQGAKQYQGEYRAPAASDAFLNQASATHPGAPSMAAPQGSQHPQAHPGAHTGAVAYASPAAAQFASQVAGAGAPPEWAGPEAAASAQAAQAATPVQGAPVQLAPQGELSAEQLAALRAAGLLPA